MMKDMHNSKNIVPASILIAGAIIAGSLVYDMPVTHKQATAYEVAPVAGVELPVVWNDLGAQLTESGVIDKTKFDALYGSRGIEESEYRKLVSEGTTGNLKITRENAGLVLNLLWALGLGNENEILTAGEMSDPKYGGAGGFASTGGWTLAAGHPMSHYSGHSFVTLTPEEQDLVDRVSRGIYRPCCNNSTHFPDCNHGMAMLGLLELMASQGSTEGEMYKAALYANSYWFPDNYKNIEKYVRQQGVAWQDINPRDVLGAKFSSGSGYAWVVSELQKQGTTSSGGGGCSV